jgi:ABC-type lipoprotein export system ATPase subunit
MSAQNVFSILRERTQQGTTVLIVTPDRDLAEGFPTIYALHNGNIKRATVQEVAKRRTQELRVLRAEDNEPLDNPERGGNQA